MPRKRKTPKQTTVVPSWFEKWRHRRLDVKVCENPDPTTPLLTDSFYPETLGGLNDVTPVGFWRTVAVDENPKCHRQTDRNPRHYKREGPDILVVPGT